jgi:hypothetical protein
MDSKEVINSLTEVSEPDVGKVNNGSGGFVSPKYPDNAYLRRNEALDGGRLLVTAALVSSILVLMSPRP